jgi:cytochrome d ubiquinol oxidase subunit II
MEHVIGPVWEANHVWLIFVLVLLWTCYPPVFAAIASTLYIPLTLVALGIIGRGAAFAFRKAVNTDAQRRLFGATFAASSVVTPFFLGAVAGAIASDRVPPGIARGHVLTSWMTPISLVTGALAVSACAFLAAVYLTGEAARATHAALAARAAGSGGDAVTVEVAGAERAAGFGTGGATGQVARSERAAGFGAGGATGQVARSERAAGFSGASVTGDLVGYFRRRAILSGVVTGALSVVGLFVARSDAPGLAHALSHGGLPLVIVSALAGCASLVFVAAARDLWARATAALAVAAVLWAWGVGRYPQLLPGLSAQQAQALPATIHATTITAIVGIALLVPSMLYLFVLFQREPSR